MNNTMRKSNLENLEVIFLCDSHVTYSKNFMLFQECFRATMSSIVCSFMTYNVFFSKNITWQQTIIDRMFYHTKILIGSDIL